VNFVIIPEIVGQSRKDRATPLTPRHLGVLRDWLAERGGAGIDPVFRPAQAPASARDTVERLLAKHAAAAA
jgi:integrase